MVLAGLALLSALPQIGGAWADGPQTAGPGPGSQYGNAFAGGADVDGDGVPDYAVGAPNAATPQFPVAGSVWIHSGADHALIRRVDAPALDLGFGWALGLAELDGDGRADLLVGAPGWPGGGGRDGAVYACSGATGAVLWVNPGAGRAFYGESLAVVPDVDGDGVLDLLAGGSDHHTATLDYAGMARLVSGASGATLHTWTGHNAFDNFGAAVSGLTDVTGDGVPDFAIGMPGYDLFGTDRVGGVVVYDGLSFQQVVAVTVSYHGPFQQFGAQLADLGDVDGDGFGDLAVSANVSGVQSTYDYGGRAYVLSGRSGVVLQEWAGEPGDWLGNSLAAPGDFDGDGARDLLVGLFQSTVNGASDGRGELRLYSSGSGALLQRFEGSEPLQHLDVAGVAGDADGDGFAEILVGAPYEGLAPGASQAEGLARHLRYEPWLHPAADRLSLGSSPPLALDLAFPPSEAGRWWALLASAAGPGSTVVANVELPLARDGVFRLLLSGLVPPALSATRGRLDGAARATTWLLPDAVLTPLLGRRLWFAAATPSLSSAVRSVLVEP